MSTESHRRDQIVAVRASLGRVLAAGQRLRGCSEQEISDLCIAVGVSEDELPPGYREYLAIAGRAHGSVASGSTLRWPAPMYLKEAALALAWAVGAGKDLERLRGQHLAFLGHQGHTYLLLAWDHSGERIVSLDEAPPFLHEPTDPMTFPDWLEGEVRSMLERRPHPNVIEPPFE